LAVLVKMAGLKFFEDSVLDTFNHTIFLKLS